MEIQEMDDAYVGITNVKYSIQGISLCISRLEESFQAENEEMTMLLHIIRLILETQLLEIEKQLVVMDHLLIESHRETKE